MKHVLIISSNIVQSKRIDLILTLEGYACIPVLEGKEALNMLLNNKFDVVFLDEKTSGITADEILSSLKAVGREVPLVVIKHGKTDKDFTADYERNLFIIRNDAISGRLTSILNDILE